MSERFLFMLNRLRERLWIRPLAMCALSILAAFVAGAADRLEVAEFLPSVTEDTVETLLRILSASMLVIATFAVGSMVSSYASAASTATPRAFTLVVADDVSQNALSSFIGAFIFSIVALVALKNEFYGTAGRFALFLLTLLVFAAVILTFVRWMDCIARLGRLGTTIEKVEAATAAAMDQRRKAQTLGGIAFETEHEEGEAIRADTVGFVQRVDVSILQACAEESDSLIAVAVLPGTFAAPDRVLAYVTRGSSSSGPVDSARIADAFLIGRDRTFQEDPRFGLIVLSEIAGRALSAAVNDPGTAIDIIGTLVRLFTRWAQPLEQTEESDCSYDRVAVPRLVEADMFDDAFTAIARDGAGTVEVAVQLQKALRSLASCGKPAMSEAAAHHARLALDRASKALALPEDLAAVKRSSMHDG